LAYKDLKNRVRIATSIDIELNDQLRKLADETRIPISKLVDEAIKDLIEKHKEQG